MNDRHEIPSRADWVFGSCNKIIEDKDQLARSYYDYMMDRVIEMFDIELDLVPENTPKKRILEYIFSGFTLVFKVGDYLYFDYGGLGGSLNEWRLPKKALINNTYIPFNAQLDIDKECVLIKCDTTMTGLRPMFEKYAYLLAETDISLRFADINSRFQFMLTADNDQTKNDAQQFINDVVEGRKFGIVGTRAFMDGTFKGATSYELGTRAKDNIKDLIELTQYLRSQWFIDLGLNANYNMKREAINSEESGMNDDILLPLVDNILDNVKEGFDKVNKMFGAHWRVDLNSSWKSIHERYHAEQDGIRKEETEVAKNEKDDSTDE